MSKICYFCGSTVDDENAEKCPYCFGSKFFKNKIEEELSEISNDPDFVQAMTKLHDEDPIEYQLKMSQFKANLQQQESSNSANAKPKEDNKVHCPYCNSTNIKKITTGSKVAHTALFGIFSMSRNSKQWHCNSCKSDF